MNLTKTFFVLCITVAVLTGLSEGFFLKKKLKKLLLAKALVKGPILAIGAASAGGLAAKAAKSKALLPAKVGVVSSLIGSASASAPAAKPEPSYYPTASASPNQYQQIPPAVAEISGYSYPSPASHQAISHQESLAPPPQTYGVPPQQTWNEPHPQSLQFYESPHDQQYQSFSGAAQPSNSYGPPGAHLNTGGYQQHTW